LPKDFPGGLQAANRSEHTIGVYRDDLLGVAARIACQLHGPDAGVERLAVSDLDGRVRPAGKGRAHRAPARRLLDSQRRLI
jgi:hypothetical protein